MKRKNIGVKQWTVAAIAPLHCRPCIYVPTHFQRNSFPLKYSVQQLQRIVSLYRIYINSHLRRGISSCTCAHNFFNLTVGNLKPSAYVFNSVPLKCMKIHCQSNRLWVIVDTKWILRTLFFIHFSVLMNLCTYRNENKIYYPKSNESSIHSVLYRCVSIRYRFAKKWRKKNSKQKNEF